MMRVGFGYDAHQFAESSSGSIMLGAVNVPYGRDIAAHSDGDVLLHALCDAMLGAAALGDIGQHFPNTSEHKDQSSSEFILQALALLREKNYSVSNVDATVILQAPKLAPHIDDMRKNIARLLAIDIDFVSVKATTNDHMGWIGRGEGLAAHVVVMIG